MTKYYLIRGEQIISTIDSDGGDVIALPLLAGGDAMSLLNEQHAQNLMANLALSRDEALAALGMADLRDTMLKSVFVGSNPVSHVSGIAAYHLIDVGDYALWQVDGQQQDLLALHARLWEMAPAATLGLLAVVQTFGDAFYVSAVRTATGMTVQQALARRDRIAVYLESLGYSNTTALRAAIDEHAQVLGVVAALGYTVQQLWAAMAE
ncbi:MAG TPA: hypothetical protein VM537_18190 [Anaerolineae bacterium]|nr:hypothetical protein [Anaerolineae bacterium]